MGVTLEEYKRHMSPRARFLRNMLDAGASYEEVREAAGGWVPIEVFDSFLCEDFTVPQREVWGHG